MSSEPNLASDLQDSPVVVRGSRQYTKLQVPDSDNEASTSDRVRRHSSVGGRVRAFFDRLNPAKPKHRRMGNGTSNDSKQSSSKSLRANHDKSGSNSRKSSKGKANDKFEAIKGGETLKYRFQEKEYGVAQIPALLSQLEQGFKEKDSTLEERDMTIRKHESMKDEHIKRMEDLTSRIAELEAENEALRAQRALAQVGSSGSMKESPSSAEIMAVLQKDANMNGQVTQVLFQKKQGVSAESREDDIYKTDKIKLVHHRKSPEAKQLIRTSVLNNDFLKHLDTEQVAQIVDCMYERTVAPTAYIIREGEPGAHLYVAEEGELEVSKEGKNLGKMGPGKIFGELAILYNCTRTASVKALTTTRLWVLDRSVYQLITMRLGVQRHDTWTQFLSNVPLFKSLHNSDRITRIADVLEEDYYGEGTYIVREGERGDRFFLIKSGEVAVTQLIDGKDEPSEIRVMKAGDYFGEKALQGDEIRTASVIAKAPGVEVLALDRGHFQQLIGDLLQRESRDYGDEKRGAKRVADQRRSGKGVSGEDSGVESQVDSDKSQAVDSRFSNLDFKQLSSLATLGVGGFGRVELVHISGDKSASYALKAMKKKHIIDTRQQEHIYNERNLMFEISTEFVVRLYKTFRDKKFVYMLMEACLGGELWSLLRDRGHFDDASARFYSGCVVEALDYLHKRHIVYRDLKPENCLLDLRGYLKLVDFGFAKRLQPGRKTWTFCGTPEYVAPEIILNKGHDHSADFWAMGIYICELLLGRPPFQASDPMKTYTLILKGVDALDIPNKRIGKVVTQLVKKLCRDNPAERIGCLSMGIEDIRKHRWFVGFDWEALRHRTLPTPSVPKVTGPLDASNFDQYPPDNDMPPDEMTGWDEGF